MPLVVTLNLLTRARKIFLFRSLDGTRKGYQVATSRALIGVFVVAI